MDEDYDPEAVISYALLQQQLGLPYDVEALDEAVAMHMVVQLIKAALAQDLAFSTVEQLINGPHKLKVGYEDGELHVTAEAIDEDEVAEPGNGPDS